MFLSVCFPCSSNGHASWLWLAVFDLHFFVAEKPLPMMRTGTIVNFHNLHSLSLYPQNQIVGKTLKCFFFHCCLVRSEGIFINFCQLLKFVCMIQFNLRITDAFSYWKLSHNLFFFPHSVRWQIACYEFDHYRDIFSDWKEMVKPPEEAACWAGSRLILRRLHTTQQVSLWLPIQMLMNIFWFLFLFRKLVGLVL